MNNKSSANIPQILKTRLWPDKCERCGVDLSKSVSIMSFFNTDIICHKCEAKEKAHPDYKKARQAEWEAYKRGEKNFPGIGKPDDL